MAAKGKRLLARRCKAGHLLTAKTASWQLSGKGVPFLQCRICNRERAKAWRAANAHRLVYPAEGGGGKRLPPGEGRQWHGK